MRANWLFVAKQTFSRNETSFMPAIAFDVATGLVSDGLATHYSRHSLVIGFL